MALSEIEKLERRYAENPQGLTFAPLAEVHRKNGDVPRALELLKPGLTLHPDYIPASIVLGRCHLDLGELPGAEAAFTHVLSLDGENVIALKALADITERQYRFDEAERWLRTLLAIDRSNDEARDQLSRVEASRRQAEVASSVTPDALLGSDDSMARAAAGPEASAPGEAVGSAVNQANAADSAESGAEPPTEHAPVMDDLVAAEPRPIGLPPLPEPPREAVLGWVEDPDGALARDVTPLELADLDLHVEPGAAEGIELDQPVSLAEPVQPIAGLTGQDQDTTEHAPRASGGFQVELSEDIVLQSAGGSEFQMANASEELLSAPPAGRPHDPLMPDLPLISAADQPPAAVPASSSWPTLEAEGHVAQSSDEATGEPAGTASEPADTSTADEGRGTPEAGAPAAAAPGETARSWEATQEPPRPAETTAASNGRDGGEAAAWHEPLADLPQSPEPDLVVTESMADLLLQQGHVAEALKVYRHLEARTSSEKYRARIAELEQGDAEEPAAGAQSSATAGAGAAASEAATPAAAAPAVASAPEPAYSVRQTQGQSAQAFLRGVLAGRLPPAEPGRTTPPQPAARDAVSTPEGAPTRPAHDSLSLSSVFGDDGTPTPPAVSSAVSAGPAGGVSFDEFYGAGGAPAATRTTRAPDPKSDDLDQFHAWLQNLKR